MSDTLKFDDGKVISGLKALRLLSEAGLNIPKTASRVTLVIDMGDVVRMYVESCAPADLFALDLRSAAHAT